jgi:sporulation protein YlmC with PRC-barrel domain
MKVFVTELQGKTIMSAEGKILGLLVIPTEEIEIDQFKTDRTGRVVLPFDKIKSMKDVIVLKPL